MSSPRKWWNSQVECWRVKQNLKSVKDTSQWQKCLCSLFNSPLFANIHLMNHSIVEGQTHKRHSGSGWLWLLRGVPHLTPFSIWFNFPEDHGRDLKFRMFRGWTHHQNHWHWSGWHSTLWECVQIALLECHAMSWTTSRTHPRIKGKQTVAKNNCPKPFLTCPPIQPLASTEAVSTHHTPLLPQCCKKHMSLKTWMKTLWQFPSWETTQLQTWTKSPLGPWIVSKMRNHAISCKMHQRLVKKSWMSGNQLVWINGECLWIKCNLHWRISPPIGPWIHHQWSEQILSCKTLSVWETSDSQNKVKPRRDIWLRCSFCGWMAQWALADKCSKLPEQMKISSMIKKMPWLLTQQWKLLERKCTNDSNMGQFPCDSRNSHRKFCMNTWWDQIMSLPHCQEQWKRQSCSIWNAVNSFPQESLKRTMMKCQATIPNPTRIALTQCLKNTTLFQNHCSFPFSHCHQMVFLWTSKSQGFIPIKDEAVKFPWDSQILCCFHWFVNTVINHQLWTLFIGWVVIVKNILEFQVWLFPAWVSSRSSCIETEIWIIIHCSWLTFSRAEFHFHFIVFKFSLIICFIMVPMCCAFPFWFERGVIHLILRGIGCQDWCWKKNLDWNGHIELIWAWKSVHCSCAAWLWWNKMCWFWLIWCWVMQLRVDWSHGETSSTDSLCFSEIHWHEIKSSSRSWRWVFIIVFSCIAKQVCFGNWVFQNLVIQPFVECFHNCKCCVNVPHCEILWQVKNVIWCVRHCNSMLVIPGTLANVIELLPRHLWNIQWLLFWWALLVPFLSLTDSFIFMPFLSCFELRQLCMLTRTFQLIH